MTHLTSLFEEVSDNELIFSRYCFEIPGELNIFLKYILIFSVSVRVRPH